MRQTKKLAEKGGRNDEKENARAMKEESDRSTDKRLIGKAWKIGAKINNEGDTQTDKQ